MRNRHYLIKHLLISVMVIPLLWSSFLSIPNIHAQQLAFPTAEGFGAYAQGGRGGDVYHVTNLNDDGAGSLRYGIENAVGPRTIVFDISGTIILEDRLTIKNPYITIAGQTAPGDGICVRDYQFGIAADHVIVRYIRARLGDQAGQESDAISITSGHNIIVDHCSASWSVDEVLSCSTGDKDGIDKVTVQWCIIAEGLYNSIHAKGSHGYGSLIRGCYGAQYSYIKNLYVHNNNRNPRPGNYDENTKALDPLGLQFDFRNNVMYNWGGSRPGYDGDTESVMRYNYVNNYGKPGPDSDPTGYAYSPECRHFRAYFSGNHFYGSIPSDQWSLVKWNDFTAQEIADYKQTLPFSTGPVVTLSAQEAFSEVINHVGASFARDAADIRVIKDVLNGTGSKIDSPGEVGGWPTLVSLPAPADTDQDGMSDEWETANGLDLNNPEDRNDDKNADGYTNLEEYLNELKPLASYLLSISNGAGGGSYQEGATVNISAGEPLPGYEFDHWSGDTDHIADVHGANTTVHMPAKDISLMAVYKLITGMLDESKHKPFHCYPNPNEGGFSIDLSGLKQVMVEIYNLHGSKVYRARAKNEVHVVKLPKLPSGIYVVQVVENGEKISDQKIIIE